MFGNLAFNVCLKQDRTVKSQMIMGTNSCEVALDGPVANQTPSVMLNHEACVCQAIASALRTRPVTTKPFLEEGKTRFVFLFQTRHRADKK
jgi:hypothetical protein